MKVLVISHMYPSSFNKVAGIFVHEQVKALVARGVEVRVVSPVPWAPFPISTLTQKWRAYNAIPDKAVWEGVPVYYPRYLAFPRSWLFASSGQRMYRGIQKLVQEIYADFQFDLIHAHVALPDGYAALLIAKRFNVPVVVTIHGQDLQQTIYRNKSSKDKVVTVINQSSKTILVSSKLKRIAEDIVCSNDKLIVIPNGIDKNGLSGFNNRLFNSEKVLLLSVSNLIYTKGIDLNLKAFARLVNKYLNLRYWIIGDGPDKRKLQQLARDLGISSCVRFLGRQPHNIVMDYIAKCDIFSLPSWKEGFGVVYLEAMAHGKPVIGCEGEGIEDFVENGRTGLLVKPQDVDSLVKALDFLLSHLEEARAMGERARNKVLSNYTWDQNAAKTIKIYKEVLGK